MEIIVPGRGPDKRVRGPRDIRKTQRYTELMKLPPLNAVRAFDAAARHLNLRHAAGDLFVTPGAISQQVRQLEQWLGVRLFDRRARGVELTEADRQFHEVVARSLRQIAQAAERLRPERNTLTVSLLPSLVARWLVPRL